MSLKKLGRYELIRVLGKGAMGVVYEGRDPNLDRRVAIKTVKVENLSREAASEYEHRFRTEARSAARLQHPNIVSVYDSDRHGNIAFLVMEYIQGDDLKHHLDSGARYSLEQSLKMIRDLLSALDYAHKQGIVHRDVKPANLLIEPGGRLKLTDFGVARIQDSGDATRTQGSMVGTLKYMSPEQVQGQKTDARADLFSAGVVLYQLLTDKRPFDGDNDFSIIHQIIGHTPASPSTYNPRLPAALDAVVARALAKNREERFAAARDFSVALQSAVRRAEDQTVVPPPDPAKKLDRSVTDSRGGRLAPGVATVPGGISSPSTVTQELELVYWKDVKDSTDPEELQGFLDKFPDGIYADLARRRLRKLASGGALDQTMLSGLVTADPDLGAARLRSDVPRPAMAPGDPSSPSVPTIPMAPSAVTKMQPAAAPPREASQQPDRASREWTDTVTEVKPPASAAASAPAAAEKAAIAPVAPVAPAVAASAAVQPPRPELRADDDTEPVRPPARKKMPAMAVAAVAILALAGVAAAVVGARKADNAAEVAAATPVPVPVPAPLPPKVSRPAPLAAAAVPAVVAPAANPAAAPASRAASAPSRPATRVAKAAPAATEPPRTAGIAPPPAPEASKLPATVAQAAGATSAVDQCKDRFFIARELCLSEHCEKPGARNHALCVKRRDDARLREESRVRQGPQ